VPRWGGDINFMHTIGEVSVVPSTNRQMYEELLRCSGTEMQSLTTI
jgi:hypothetical protein